MQTSTPTESARINFRTSAELKTLIERAASITGATVSSFISQTMYETSSRIVSETDTLMLSQEAFEAFVSVCENPPEPTEALRKLMALR
jgi:uncharacterized protein (DUF1778 family)